MKHRYARIALFLIGCMGARFGLAYYIKTDESEYKEPIAALLFIIAIGFFHIYRNNLRQTGMEVFGDEIWWNNLRPVHAMMYLLAAGLVYINHKYAYLVILADTLIGLIFFTVYHLMTN